MTMTTIRTLTATNGTDFRHLIKPRGGSAAQVFWHGAAHWCAVRRAMGITYDVE